MRTLKPEDECIDTESIFFKNIFDLYGSCSNSADNNDMYLMNFVKKYEKRKDKLIKQTKRTVVVAFPYRSSDPSSQYHNSCCKRMFIKQNP